MDATLRVNEALLIAGHAFEPFHCVAWTQQDGDGALSLTVIDDHTSHSLCRAQLPLSAYSDPQKLATALEEVRAGLSRHGYSLQPWTMPVFAH
ncbi:hypothetical protein [Pseudomonas sp. RIT-PI-S]|uniref:hypothetical protein n=1 Tax=Pseudomonas sp. RIT-PI-S TaxID=3035295 RepID=UPI0021D81421|nr:hypothetical protein [Pseudomonas sp. RIT-PI-S]